MKSEELKPCPFCGGEAEISRYGDKRKSTIYTCLDCGCTLETGEEYGHGRAWNTRTESGTKAISKEELKRSTNQEIRHQIDIDELERELSDTKARLDEAVEYIKNQRDKWDRIADHTRSGITDKTHPDDVKWIKERANGYSKLSEKMDMVFKILDPKGYEKEISEICGSKQEEED